ncbi:MAG: CHASE2 domain-containing protein [Gammaproteobacteria bacterium]
MSSLSQRLKTRYARLADDIGRRLRQNFFLYLAVLFSLVAIGDTLTGNAISGMRQTTFDMMVRMRINVPSPADDIVIVDIDEKTLAAMAPDYGRWPWPRQVLAEFAEQIAGQHPQAIVFDVLFSDPDIQNPDSDAYFNEVLAALPNTFLPMLRLSPTHDGESALRYAQVPGATRADPAAREEETVALVVPPFAGAQVAGRLGTINVEPDVDGVTRSYPVRMLDDGWALPSMPAIVARATGKDVDPPDAMLLNWRGKPFTYRYASFSDVYLDLQRETRTRPADEFAGKIVIIGSTAAGLHDIKGTPLDKQFPGVEILATAIDNLRSGDWLRVPEIRSFYLLVTLLVVWGTAWAFYRAGANAKVDRFFGASQVALLGFSYATVNLGNVYINLTGPVMFGLAYFSVARFYAFATEHALDSSLVARLERRDGTQRGLLLVLQFPVPTREEAALEKLAARLQKTAQQDMSVERLQGRQRGLWRLFENTLIVCWSHPVGDLAAQNAVRAEADALIAQLAQHTKAAGVAAALPAARVIVRRAEGQLRGRQPEDWRLLLAAALITEEGEAP